MKYKITVLIVLAIAIVAILTVKAARTGDTIDETNNLVSPSNTSLIEQAKQNRKPAWLLFHSST